MCDRVWPLLSNNEDKLHLLKDSLMQFETLTGSEVNDELKRWLNVLIGEGCD